MSIEHRELGYGSKTLSLDINWETGSASVRFGTRFPRLLFPKVEGETTEIFLEAERTIFDLVGKNGIPLTLKFDTANLKLKLWAKARKELLGFDIEPDGFLDYRITISKKYF